MQKFLLAIDRISTVIGQTFSWFIVALTLMISWEVFSRYVLDAPHPWAFDVMIMMYGTVFMMAGAYTLSKNGHVRGDVLYGFFPPRLQAGLDLTLYILFFIPGVFALAFCLCVCLRWLVVGGGGGWRQRHRPAADERAQQTPRS